MTNKIFALFIGTILALTAGPVSARCKLKDGTFLDGNDKATDYYECVSQSGDYYGYMDMNLVNYFKGIWAHDCGTLKPYYDLFAIGGDGQLHLYWEVWDEKTGYYKLGGHFIYTEVREFHDNNSIRGLVLVSKTEPKARQHFTMVYRMIDENHFGDYMFFQAERWKPLSVKEIYNPKNSDPSRDPGVIERSPK